MFQVELLKSLICSGSSGHLLIEKLSDSQTEKSKEGFTFNGIEKNPAGPI